MLQATRGLSLLALIWCHAILLARAQVGLTALRVDNLVASASSIEPFFSWTINSTSEYRVSQESYQISVSRLGGEEIWNSGVTSSSRTQLIQYTGPQLLPHIPYTWSIKVSTSAGPAVASSELLANSSKYDVWVGKRDEPLPSELDKHFESSSWIWTADGSLDDAPPGNRGFRYTFDVPPEETALSALIKVTVDDRFSIYVNGDQIDTHSGWQKGQQYDIRFPPDTTRIAFAINGTNNRSRAGVITAIQVILSNGESHFLQSDDTWRSIVTIPDGFESSKFDDASWPNATVLGPFGIEPWTKNITFPPKPKVIPNVLTPKLSQSADVKPTSTKPVVPSTPSSPTYSTTQLPNPSPTTTGVDTNIGAILGGVFGGIILILVALVGYLWHSQKIINRAHTGQPHLFDLEYAHRGSFLSMAESLPSSISSPRHLPPTSISPSMSVSAVAERNRKK